MAAYAFRRLLWLGPALFFISLVTFGLMHAVNGGPWDSPDPRLPAEVKRNLMHKYGLDKPLYEQYVIYMGNLSRGDLGLSMTMQQDRPVTDIVLSGARATTVLGLLALAVAAVAGISLGVVSALNRNRAADYCAVGLATVGAAVPGFVLGIFFIYFFAVGLHWFPTGGWSLRTGLIPGWLPQPKYMVLPVLTLSALPAAYLARITRASLLEVLHQDYIRTARAKGLASSTVIRRHAMRNAAIPIVSVFGPLAAALITGSFIIERVFNVPGVGGLFVKAVSYRDYNVIMGMTLFYATVAVVVNLMIDIGYVVVDPRIRYR